jgi:hypothetical protein
VSEDPTKLDAQLDVRHFYSQVPGLAAGDRGVLDLLGITRRGRLVVIVLKASEDIQMPIPAVNFWLRVRRHQREEDFQEYGYIEIDRWCGLWPPATLPFRDRHSFEIFVAGNSAHAHGAFRELA